jgi:hypothetical protein
MGRMAFNQAETVSAEIDTEELRQLLATSDEFFIEYFLIDEIAADATVQDFHLVTFGRATDMEHRKDVCALPRDHAKTTYARLAWVKKVYFSPVQFFVYMGSTHSAAASSVESIWNRVTGDQGVAAFGAPYVIKERLSEGYVEFVVTAYNPETLEPYEKLVIFKALGVGQSLRGMNVRDLRPQYVTCDDIEDETAVKTEEGYLKLKHWFDNTFMRAVSRVQGLSKVFQIGNLIGAKTLLNDNINDPEWRSIRMGVLRRNGDPLWPGQWTKELIRLDIERAKRRGGLSAWFGEMMNIPYNVENALIPYESIYFQPRRHPADGREYKTFITIDPAISKKTSGDHAAIVLHTIDGLGLPQCSEYVHQRGMSPAVMAQVVKDMCARWNCRVIGCESVQLQAVLLSYFELAFEMDDLFGYDFVPINVGTAHKTARLSTWASAIMDKSYCLSEGDWGIARQLFAFDIRKDNNDDDLIDACSMGLIMLKDYKQEIFANRAGHSIITAVPKQSTTNI